MNFECLNCCDCCKNLLRREKGFLHSLSLFPDETHLFPSDHVFPQLGIGPYGGAKRILLYQLGLDTCPHLQGRSCAIYDKRPLACRSYPFLLEAIEPYRITVEEHCRWFREKVVASGLSKKVLTSKEWIVAPDEIKACWELFERLKEFQKEQGKWRFDLNVKAWYRPSS